MRTCQFIQPNEKALCYTPIALIVTQEFGALNSVRERPFFSQKLTFFIPEGSTEPRFGGPETEEMEAPKPENGGLLGPLILELKRIFQQPRIMEGADHWVKEECKALSSSSLDILAADDCMKKVIARVALWDHGYRSGGVDKTRIPFMLSLVERRKKNVKQQ